MVPLNTTSHILRIDTCRNAHADPRSLRRSDPRTATAISMALQQLGADPGLIDKLTTWGRIESGTQEFDNKRWLAARRHGSLWRLRILNTPARDYRVFHAFHWPTRFIWVLAVVHRSHIDYDDLDSFYARRILDDWHAIDAGDV